MIGRLRDHRAHLAPRLASLQTRARRESLRALDLVKAWRVQARDTLREHHARLAPRLSPILIDARLAILKGRDAAWALLAPPIIKWLGQHPRLNARLMVVRARGEKRGRETVSVARTCLSLAAANLLDQRPRLLAAIAGVAVALFLLLLQVSILQATREKVTALYDDFAFDIAIVPDSYQFLMSFDTLDRIALDIARATGDVADTYGVNINVVYATQPASKRAVYNLLIGLDPPAGFVSDKAIRAGWPALETPHALIADRYSQPAAGPVSSGSALDIGDERMTVRGQFKLGLFFYAEGALIARNLDFARLTGRDPRAITLGLVKVKPGISLAKARADIAAALPSGMLVMTKAQLERQERDYFLSTKPIGVMIYINMVIACLVGGAIIVQVLSTEVANRIGEYAVLKAMGAEPTLVYGVGMSQAAIMALGGLGPALIAGWAVLGIIRWRTHLPAVLGPSTIVSMLAITAVLAAAAGAFAVRRVDKADPASLF